MFRIFTQPQVKSALKMFGDQLEWINNLLENYMKDNKMGTDFKAPIDEGNKKKSKSSKLSFKSKSNK